MNLIGISFLQKLDQWDKHLFVKLNGEWTNSFFNTIMPYLRSPFYWTPLYVFILLFAVLNYGIRGLWWIIFLISTVALTDMTGTYVFKKVFERIRPCNNPDMLAHLRLLVRCPSGWGFVSNHAANHFGMATFLFLTFRHLFRNWTWLIFLWAGAIGYAQIYVGVHYPSDIAGGMALGIIYGTFTGLVFNKYFGLHFPVKSLS